MTPGQRRTLWACTFVMTFIFWFEASGKPLVWDSNTPEFGKEITKAGHYWDQLAYGLVFLVLGAAISIMLSYKKEKMRAYHPLDWVGLSVGLGILAGILYLSYKTAMGIVYDASKLAVKSGVFVTSWPISAADKGFRPVISTTSLSTVPTLA